MKRFFERSYHGQCLNRQARLAVFGGLLAAIALTTGLVISSSSGGQGAAKTQMSKANCGTQLC